MSNGGLIGDMTQKTAVVELINTDVKTFCRLGEIGWQMADDCA